MKHTPQQFCRHIFFGTHSFLTKNSGGGVVLYILVIVSLPESERSARANPQPKSSCGHTSVIMIPNHLSCWYTTATWGEDTLRRSQSQCEKSYLWKSRLTLASILLVPFPLPPPAFFFFSFRFRRFSAASAASSIARKSRIDGNAELSKG